MSDSQNLTDEFLSKLCDLKLLHVDLYDRGAVLWVSKDDLLRHFLDTQTKKLQADNKGR